MSSIDQLLDALDNSRETLLMAIEPLSDAALLEKQAIGEWSVCDVLNNITAWEAELVTGMMHLRQNKRPSRLLDAIKDPSSYDRQRYTENQERDLDQVFIDLQQVRVKVEEWISEFSERELDNPKRYQSLKGKALKEIVAESSYERERKFIPHIQLFAKQWTMFEIEEDDGIIALTTIKSNVQENNHENEN